MSARLLQLKQPSTLRREALRPGVQALCKLEEATPFSGGNLEEITGDEAAKSAETEHESLSFATRVTVSHVVQLWQL